MSILRLEGVVQDCNGKNGGKEEEDGWEDRSAIQGTNPGLAELIKERQEGIARESARLEALTHEEKEKQLGAIRIEQEV